jgi:hypothetical protein
MTVQLISTLLALGLAGAFSVRIDVAANDSANALSVARASASADDPQGARGRARGRDRETEAEPAMRFAGMDRNGDRVITREEWRGSAASFRIHDWNDDGVLSDDEVRPGAARQGPFARTGNANAGFVPDWSRRTFDALDRDRNGQITLTEWQYDVETFRRVDANRDRVITMREFTASEVDDDRDDGFENLDMNNDGYLSGTEWHGSAETFDWLDQNNDQRLSRQEVRGDQSVSGVDGDRTPGGTAARFTVPGNVAWYDTGLVVTAGDDAVIRATGEIQWTPDSSHRATADGSQSGGRAGGAPLPQAPVGTLIARVGNSAPFVATAWDGRIRFPRSGRLWLGINDDHVADNSGAYDVTVRLVDQ